MANNIYASISTKESLGKYVLAFDILENENKFIKMEVFNNQSNYAELIKILKTFKDNKGNCLTMHMIQNKPAIEEFNDDDATEEEKEAHQRKLAELEYLKICFNKLVTQDIHKNNDGNTLYLLNLMNNEPFAYIPSDEELNTMNNANKAPLDIMPDLVVDGKLLLDGETLLHVKPKSLDQNTLTNACQTLFEKYLNSADLKNLKFLINKKIHNTEITNIDEALKYFLQKGLNEDKFMDAIQKDPKFEDTVKKDSEFLLDEFRKAVIQYYGNSLASPSIKLLKLINFMKKNIDKMDLTKRELIPIPDDWLGVDDLKVLVEKINNI